MKLVIGLGNPGKEYQNNRHNVGFMLLEFLISNSKFLINIQNLKIFKSDAFMNDSGKFVARKLGEFGGLGRFGGENLFIVHDDLDIPFGQFKIQFGVGPKVHNGLLSVEQTLGTNQFWRIRIGTDNRKVSILNDQFSRTQGKDYVLDDFMKEERDVLDKLFPKIYEEFGKRSC